MAYMNDPQVVALIYRVTHWENVSFDEAEPLQFETPQFTVQIEKGTARFDFKVDYSDVKQARAEIEPFIDMWEMWDALNPELSGFKLVYSKPEVVDRDPRPGNYAHMVLPALRMSASGVQNIGRRYYPEPPTEQAAMNADVKVMAYRYWLYRQDRDRLAAMAYFCLTVLETSSGQQKMRRKHAARKYNVDMAVLNKIGELTVSKGGPDARKGDGVTQKFTTSERMWIELTVKKLIRRAGEIADDPSQQLPAITMGAHHPFD